MSNNVEMLQCDIEDFLNQIRADMSLLEHKVDADLKDDAQAIIHRIADDIDAIERCADRIISELMLT